ARASRRGPGRARDPGSRRSARSSADRRKIRADANPVDDRMNRQLRDLDRPRAVAPVAAQRALLAKKAEQEAGPPADEQVLAQANVHRGARPQDEALRVVASAGPVQVNGLPRPARRELEADVEPPDRNVHAQDPE